MAGTSMGLELQAAGWAAVLGGTLLTFLGYRIFHAGIRAYGILAGLIAAALAAPDLSLPEGRLGWAALAGLGAAGAALGWFLSRPCFYALLFLTGAALGPIAWTTLAAAPAGSWVDWAAPAALGLIGGTLALILERPLVILGTALAGPTVAAAGLLLVLGRADFPPEADLWVKGAVFGSAAVGAVVQFLQKPAAPAKPA